MPSPAILAIARMSTSPRNAGRGEESSAARSLWAARYGPSGELNLRAVSTIHSR